MKKVRTYHLYLNEDEAFLRGKPYAVVKHKGAAPYLDYHMGDNRYGRFQCGEIHVDTKKPIKAWLYKIVSKGKR